MIREIKTRMRKYVASVLKERLEPVGAGVAVFLGLFIGIVPIYGLQTLTAIGLALLFRLNKPLIVGCTFINNPLLQPLLIVSSVEVGFFLRHGHYHSFKFADLSRSHLKEDLLYLVLGSLVLGVIVGGVGALITALVIYIRQPTDAGVSEGIRFVNQTFSRSSIAERSFVRWKLRLDRIFDILAAEEPGSGTVVDLGCGYGMALSLMACREKSRRLVGCDLSARRIAVAHQALSLMNAELCVEDVRRFKIPQAGLILILDVLQFLSADDQLDLLKRCCAALDADGRLIFRMHDRERGLRSVMTLVLDRMLFMYERAKTRPVILFAAQYQQALEEIGMQVEMRRFQNRLPLAHVLFVVKRPIVEIAQ